MSVVTIRTSLDKPFGKLANDAVLPFKVKSRVYSSVVNYVYANLLPESTFREELSHTFPKDVLKTFHEVRKHLKQATIQSAAHLAITEKAKQNADFFRRLMDTDKLKILYYSENSYLGVGRKQDGENIYGQALEQYRNETQIEQDKDKQKDEIYLTYIAEINLKKALRKHSLEKYISKSKNRSIRRLVEALVHDYGKTEVYSNAPDIETIIALHEKRNVMSYTDPNSLIRIIRKNNARGVLKKNLAELKNIALHTLVDYIISKSATLSEDKTALKDQIFDILPSKRDEFANRILDLYSAKALPDEVRKKLKSFKSEWYFPSDKDIEFFETEKIKLPEINGPPSPHEQHTFKVYYTDLLSPLDESSVLVINGLKFKSVSQYIAFESNKLYDPKNPGQLYMRMKDIKAADLERHNKILEKDIFATTKNKLLEEAIDIKRQGQLVKNLLFSLCYSRKLEFEDSFGLELTEQIYNRHRDRVNLRIHKIPSFDQFVEKDPFVADVIKDKVDFYFMILDNLMVHAKSKHRLQVTYDDLVEMSPFYSHVLRGDSSVPRIRIPDYLVRKNKEYGLKNHSLLQIWSIVFNGMKQSERIVGRNGYDIRYKSLLIWSKYLLGKANKDLRTPGVMQSHQEDAVLLAFLAILSKLKEINMKFECPTVNNQDLQTALYLCLGKVRVYRHEFERAEESLEFEEEEVNPYEVEIYDEEGEEDHEFEGFNLSSKRKFEVFLGAYFSPLKTELTLAKMEDAVYKVVNSKVPSSLKHQNVNFFTAGYKLPPIEAVTEEVPKQKQIFVQVNKKWVEKLPVSSLQE